MSEARAAFAHRLNEAFDRLGIPPKQHGRFTALARLFGVSAVAARDWCEGKSYPSVDKLLVILDTVRCGADWLLYGRSAPQADGTAAAGADGVVAAARLPADGPAQAGDPGAAARLERAGADPGDAQSAWLAVDSDSMAPTLLAGDRVRIASLAGGSPADGVHLVHAVGETASSGLRRIQRGLDGRLTVSCDNPLYGERGVYLPVAAGRLAACSSGTADLQVVGKVAEFRRSLP